MLIWVLASISSLPHLFARDPSFCQKTVFMSTHDQTRVLVMLLLSSIYDGLLWFVYLSVWGTGINLILLNVSLDNWCCTCLIWLILFNYVNWNRKIYAWQISVKFLFNSNISWNHLNLVDCLGWCLHMTRVAHTLRLNEWSERHRRIIRFLTITDLLWYNLVAKSNFMYEQAWGGLILLRGYDCKLISSKNHLRTRSGEDVSMSRCDWPAHWL